tara:strand:- start:5 stop:262 length:258 start_codon:yes stop_codon:yes gene_type:complete
VIGFLLVNVGFEKMSAREVAAFIGLPTTLVTVIATVLINKSKSTSRDWSEGALVLFGGLLMIGWIITILITLPALFWIVNMALDG